MRKKAEERKFENTPTSELLDVVGQKANYDKPIDYEKQQDMSDELELRNPFNHIKSKCDRMQKEIEELREVVKHLLTHEHGVNGKPNIPIDNVATNHYFKRW